MGNLKKHQCFLKFSTETHNVVDVKNCESFREFEESPVVFSLNNEPHIEVNVNENLDFTDTNVETNSESLENSLNA